MTEPIIRPAAPDDADRIFDLLGQLAASYQPRRDKFDQNLPALIESTDAILLVAEVDSRVLGYALSLRVPTLFANGDIWNLQELVVDAAHRSLGCGALLLARTIADARDRGAVEVTVASRRAGGYYEKHGFTDVANYYKLKLTDHQMPHIRR